MIEDLLLYIKCQCEHIIGGSAITNADEISVLFADKCAAAGFAFHSCQIDQLSCAFAFSCGWIDWILEHTTCRSIAHWLRALFVFKDFFDMRTKCNGICRAEIAVRGNDNASRQRRVSISKVQISSCQRAKFSAHRHQFNRVNALCGVAIRTACVHANCATNCGGNSSKLRKPGKSTACRFLNDPHQINTCADSRGLSIVKIVPECFLKSRLI